MNKDQFINELKSLGVEISPQKLLQLESYFKILVETNKTTNLTRITTKEEVYLKHFYDSLTITKVINLNQKLTLCDIGSGAGFPGIVLKIFFPNLDVTLIDSTNKKVVFLNKVIKELNLTNIKAICERVENHKPKYDIVTSRAVAKLNILIELCIPITKKNGNFIAMKANLNNELTASTKALELLKSELTKVEEFLLPIENSTRTLIKITKKEETNKQYPRKFDKIVKNPL